MRQKQNSKARARFNRKVVFFGACAILALLALAAWPAVSAHPETLPLLGCIGFMPIGRRRMQSFDSDKGGGGGTMTQDQFQAKVLGVVEGISEKQKALDDALKGAPSAEEVKKLQDEYDNILKEVRDLRRVSLAFGEAARVRRPGQISHECGKFIGALTVVRAIQHKKITKNVDVLMGLCKEIVGKDVLDTGDIPLPTGYAAEIVELVAEFGTARRLGTVFPLPEANFKLPRLGTDPDFGPIEMAQPIDQKTPGFAWVDFAAKKWGGLVIIPNEIDSDSIVAIGIFVARYSARKMAKCEDNVFWIADGTPDYHSLKGLTVLVVENEKIATLGGGLTHHADVTLEDLRGIRSKVNTSARNRGAYYMNGSWEAFLSGLNQNGDKPYIANGGQGATLDGYRIEWVESLPAYDPATANAGTVPILFGDASYHYLGVREAMRLDVSDQVGFANDLLYIRALERFTTGLTATDALSGLKLAAA